MLGRESFPLTEGRVNVFFIKVYRKRLFKEFSKENEDFEIKALSVGGKLLGSESIDVLANLPTLEQALGMLASVALAPVINIVRTLNEVPTQVTRTMAAIRDQKGEAA